MKDTYDTYTVEMLKIRCFDERGNKYGVIFPIYRTFEGIEDRLYYGNMEKEIEIVTNFIRGKEEFLVEELGTFKTAKGSLSDAAKYIKAAMDILY